MTATARLDRVGRVMAGSTRSVRQRLAALSPVSRAMIGLIAIVEVVDGFRVLGAAWQSGDLLYHSALANAIVRGELPPGGPYEGLPAYYPPLFHVMLALPMALLGLDAATADRWLTLLWLPVLPIGTFLLARWLTGRPWVAFLAAVITCFAGGYDLAAGRLWVNSLFLSGQQAYPLYPRDVVFALLPFGLLAFLRAFGEQRRGRVLAWAGLAGVVFGLAGLTQIQLLLPLPVALIVAAIVAGRRPAIGWERAGVATLTTGLVAAVVVAPWLLVTIGTIARNGGVDLDSSDMLEPARFGFWSYPREFGLVLPLGIVGAGLALLFLRRTVAPGTSDPIDGPWTAGGAGAVGAHRAAPGDAAVAGLILLVAWFAVAFSLAVLYQPSWPLEDALRPQRLWLLASQPLAILAAMGLALVAELLTSRWSRPRLVLPLVAATLFVMCAPTTLATVRLVSTTWTRPSYAHLDLVADRVPDFASLLSRTGPRSTVLTYEDWGALTWFETGSWVVALDPPGYGKLAYDPGKLTGHSQDQRRADLATAFDGDPADLTRVADLYGAQRLVIASGPAEPAGLGLFDESAAVAAGLADDAVAGSWSLLSGNGWDAAALDAGSVLRLSLGATGRAHLELRVAGAQQGVPVPARSFELTAITTGGGQRTLAQLTAPATSEPWQRLSADVELGPGERLAITAVDPVTIQSVRGYLDASAAADHLASLGWRVTRTTGEAAVLERQP